MADLHPIIYIAGPITGDPWGCVKRATKASEELWEAFGFLSYLPQLSVLHEMINAQPYEFWINHGLNMVERCDGLLRLTGPSRGADMEVDYAVELGIPVTHYHDDIVGGGQLWRNSVISRHRNRRGS